MVWSYIHNDQQNLLDKEKKLDITPEQEASENKINAMGRHSGATSALVIAAQNVLQKDQ